MATQFAGDLLSVIHQSPTRLISSLTFPLVLPLATLPRVVWLRGAKRWTGDGVDTEWGTGESDWIGNIIQHVLEHPPETRERVERVGHDAEVQERFVRGRARV